MSIAIRSVPDNTHDATAPRPVLMVFRCVRTLDAAPPDSPVSFGDWLCTQRHRNSPTGDLARDFVRDQCRGSESPEALRARMFELRACDGAMRALTQAAAAWRRAMARKIGEAA